MRFSFLKVFAVFAVLFLGACDNTTPSQLKTGQIRLQKEMKTVVLYPADGAKVEMVADDYHHNNKGPMTAVMGYLSNNPLQEAEVRRQGNAYKQAFAKAGVKDIKIDYVGVTDPERTGYAVLSYPAMTAQAPDNCMPITGYDGADTRSVAENYAFGCETKTAISKMISRPEDLMGRAGSTNEDSRRAGTAVEKYKAGTPNTKMQGINASTVGSGG